MASQRPTCLKLAHSPQGLPKDVIRETFALFAGTTLVTSQPGEYPWFLGHICSTWRSVFLSMSAELWSSISISFGLEGNERHKNIIRFFLERDPTAPFSLNVDFPETTTSEQEEDHMFNALEILVNASNRWKDVSFQADLRHLLPLTRIKNRLPLLQRFKLDLRCDREFCPLFDVFQNAPSLTAIGVDELAGWEFNLANLTAITIHNTGSGASNFIAALPQLPKLEQLTIDKTSLLPSSIILLPNLIKLDCELRLLSFLEAPSLQDLSIYCGSKGDDKIVQSFLCRSSCNMNILSLGIKMTKAVTAIEIIKLTPQIVHLKLVYVDDVGKAYKHLTISTEPGQEWLACHMQSLSIKSYDLCDKLLCNLVSSRTINNAAGNCGYERLQKLVVQEGQGFGNSTVAKSRLIALCKERGVQYAENEL